MGWVEGEFQVVFEDDLNSFCDIADVCKDCVLFVIYFFYVKVVLIEYYLFIFRIRILAISSRKVFVLY